MSTKSLGRVLAASIPAIALILGGVAPANAASPNPAPNDQEQTVQRTVVNEDCLAQMRAATSTDGVDGSTNVCTSTLVLRASAARPVTPKDLVGAKASMRSSDYATLLQAMATSSVKAKSYSQTISQITDEERQYGTFFYNGSRAWVTNAYLGFDGTHFCVVNYEFGMGVTNQACTDSGSTTQRNLTMIWKMSLIVSNGPISWSERYDLHVNKSGSIWQ